MLTPGVRKWIRTFLTFFPKIPDAQLVDEQYQNAISKGATSLLEPTTEPWGQRTCFIADPEGNVIEIGSWDKPYEEKDK